MTVYEKSYFFEWGYIRGIMFKKLSMLLFLILLAGCVTILPVEEYKNNDASTVKLSGIWSAVGYYQNVGDCYTRKIMPKGKSIKKKNGMVIPESTVLSYPPEMKVFYSFDRMMVAENNSIHLKTASCRFATVFETEAFEDYEIKFWMNETGCRLNVVDSKGEQPRDLILSDDIRSAANFAGIKMCEDFLNGGMTL